MAKVEMTQSFSKIRFGDAQGKLEQIPSDLIPAPQTSGSYVIDDSVAAGLHYVQWSLKAW